MSAATVPFERALNSARLGLPLYALLLLDVVNGSVSLAVPGMFAPIALGSKAFLALLLALQVGWRTGDFVLTSALCAAACLCAIFLDLQSESLLLLIKVCSAILLLHLVFRYVSVAGARSINNFLSVSFLVLLTSGVLGFLGVGYERYSGVAWGLGSNGFLPAGNEVNIALVAIFWWLLDPRSSVAPGLRRLLATLCFFLMIASLSKTTILAAAIFLGYRSFGRTRTIFIGALSAPVAIFLFLQSEIWQRWVYFYEMYSNSGFLASITGGRFARVEELEVSMEMLLLKGGGVLNETGGYIESDAMDLLYNFGVTGLVLYAMFLGCLLVASRPNVLPVIVIAGVSFLAGHVVYSVFAVPIIACSLAAVASTARASGKSYGEFR